MKELVVISGKGGTGKTSLTASFARLADQPVIADCDVDAADLHLVLRPQVKERHNFYSGREVFIRPEHCIGCGVCADACRFEAIKEIQKPGQQTLFTVDPISCEGCGVCVRICPVQAVDFLKRLCGEWMVSETPYGSMVHARLGVAAENSGKLVSTVRREAARIAAEEKGNLIIVDGPPGIGCPVIASITGASQVLVVTEPTVSGEHDLERVLYLARHFSIPATVCVNKWDLNPQMTERIEKQAVLSGSEIAGRIRYDRSVTQAQLRAQAVVETEAPCVEDIITIWNYLSNKKEVKCG
ncbi:MAG TPA: ATP-binding protein [Smithellaceae bacterium]|nr:ATP-binding protein [Smithellaceae bacterium]